MPAKQRRRLVNLPLRCKQLRRPDQSSQLLGLLRLQQSLADAQRAKAIGLGLVHRAAGLQQAHQIVKTCQRILVRLHL